MLSVYLKPNGVEVSINDASVEYAKSLGWKKKEDAEQAPKPKAKKKAS